jgi:hypothetical protein
MNKFEVLSALERGKKVSRADYEDLLRTEGSICIIAALKNRFEITNNPKTIVEIFRLANINFDFRSIVIFKKTVLNLKNIIDPDDYEYCKRQIGLAEMKIRQKSVEEIKQRTHEINKQRDSEQSQKLRQNLVQFDMGKSIYQKKISNFEKHLLDVSIDNPNLYEFLKDEQYRKKRYK